MMYLVNKDSVTKQTLLLYNELTPTRSWPLNSKKMPWVD